MANNQWRGLRRHGPFARNDFSITALQLVAIGQPHRSIHDMLAVGETADASDRSLNLPI